MRTPSRLSLLLTLLASACTLDDTLPPGAVVVCLSDADCPKDIACDLVRHECREPGASGTSPALVDATFDPPFADEGFVRLRIEADEPLDGARLVLDLVGAEELEVGAAGGFALSTEGTDTAPVFVADVTDAPEGAIALASVTLVDLEGNAALVPVINTSLGIDHTPATVTIVSLGDGTPEDGATFTNLPEFDDVVLVARVDEPVASISARVGAADVECELVGLEAACVGLLPADIANGSNDVVVTAIDRAGISSSASRSIDVDAKAPAVIAGSTSVEIIDVGGGPASQLAPGRVAVVRFVLDEAPASGTVSLRGPATIPVTSLVVIGSLVEARFAPDQVLIEGDYRPFVDEVVDAFGHAAADLEVPLAAPFTAGIPVTSVLGGPCAPPAGAPIPCPDYDGDGALGAAVGCPSALVADCDDLDPTVFDGAFDVPGDGLDNDCVGDGDTDLYEATAVFVDESFTGVSTGTRVAPFTRVEDAVAAAGGRAIAVRSGELSECSNFDVPNGLLGGLDASWLDSGAVTTFNCDLRVGVVLRRAESPFSVSMEDGIAIESSAGGFFSLRNARAIDITATILDAQSDVRIVGADVVEARIFGAVGDFVDVTVTAFFFAESSSLTLVRADVTSGSEIVGGDARFFSSVLRESGGPVVVSDGAGVALVGTILARSDAGAILEANNGGGFSTRGALFDSPGGSIITGFAATTAGVAAYEACVGCDAIGNAAGAAIFLDGQHHLADVANNAAIGAGVDPFLEGAPPSAVRDIDGACVGVGDVWHAGLDVP